jgi:hypothetical protein
MALSGAAEEYRRGMRDVSSFARLVPLVFVPLALSLASSARAEETSRSVNEGMHPDFLLHRRHTIAEVEAGILALPNAPISGRIGGDTPFGPIAKGDATLLTGLHLLYRGDELWAIGAGASFGPQPTADDEYGGASGLSRSHARSYLKLVTEGRVIPLRFRTIEGWVGLTFGAVIVADRYVTNTPEPVPPILGSKEVTVRTEGLAMGVQGGIDWLFTERLVAGLAVRLDEWLLPSERRCSAITTDCSTLNGSVTAVEVGIKLGYRIPL